MGLGPNSNLKNMSEENVIANMTQFADKKDVDFITEGVKRFGHKKIAKAFQYGADGKGKKGNEILEQFEEFMIANETHKFKEG